MWPTPDRDSKPATDLDIQQARRAFTLLELLVSMVVVGFLMLILVQTTTSTSNLWRGTTDKIKSFQNARSAFEGITQSLSQATLNTYYEYYDVSGNRYSGQGGFTPAICDRASELHFVSAPSAKLLAGITRNGSPSGPYSSLSPGHAIFFQSPLGYSRDPDSSVVNLDNTLNALGFFVEFGSDQDFLPLFLKDAVNPRYRYRLMQFFQPSEEMAVYSENWSGHSNGAKASWFSNPLSLALKDSPNVRPASVLADNILFLVLRPKRSDKEYDMANPKPKAIAPDYTYDSRPLPNISPAQMPNYPSRHQLPPIVAVTLVAIDETSASRLEQRFGTTPPLQGLGINNLFQNETDTNNPTQYQADLETLKSVLTQNRVTFRIFETEVMLRSSKWTKD
jgi:uncharacterized protein (TIGR02599 family)